MLDAATSERGAQPFALLDAHGADEDWPPCPLDLLHLRGRNLFAVLAVLELDGYLAGLIAFDRAHQNLAVGRRHLVELVNAFDLVDDRLELLGLAAIDDVRIVVALHRAIRGNRDDVELVDLPELVGLGHAGAGHAADFVVPA